jgi:uncharacterized protein
MTQIRRIREVSAGEAGRKGHTLLEILAEHRSALVAFSGGVDSSLLLAAAREGCTGAVIAVTASSPIHPRREIEDARRIAALVGVRHEIVKTHEMGDPRFVKNPLERCYLCKRGLFAELKRYADGKGLAVVLEGSTVEDLSDFRPGEKALRETGARSPLRQADFTKADVRALAKAIGLPNWDKPAGACLATRFPYGTEITRELLGKVERIEEVLMALGFGQVRARFHGEVMRIEVPSEEIELAAGPDVRERIVQTVRREGLRYAALDLQGYRTGSLNP